VVGGRPRRRSTPYGEGCWLAGRVWSWRVRTGAIGGEGSEEASGLMVGVRSCVAVNYYMLREDGWPLKDGVPWVGL
jgi:hypothetical protein